MPPEDVDKMANSVDPDQTAPGGLEEQSFGVCTVCLFVSPKALENICRK